jgi:Predicted metal-dependent membrane protease
MQTQTSQRLLLLGKIFFSVVAFFFVIFLQTIVLEAIPTDTLSKPIFFVISGGLGILFGMSIFALFVKGVDDEKFISSDWLSLRNRGKDFFIGGLIGCASVVLGFLVIINIDWSQVAIAPFRGSYLLGSFFMILCAAFLEELFFRGYMFRKLLESFSLITSLLISSVIFGALHYLNDGATILSTANVILVGMVMGLMFLKTQNIWLVTGFHAIWNYVQAILGFNVSGNECPSILTLHFESENFFNGGYFGLEGSYICTIILLLLLCLFYKSTKRQKANSCK